MTSRKFTQRLTVTRMVTLGVFSLAAPKRKKINEWCVAVRWQDATGMGRAAVFEFVGSNPAAEANRAANLLMSYVLRKSDPMQVSASGATEILPSVGSRTCPYCAETIKLAAIVCRFCNRELQPSAKAALQPAEPA